MPKSSVLVLTSTYPRWKGDSTPRFVESLCIELKKSNKEIFVLAPHTAQSKTYEELNGMIVHRYRYAPESLEKLAYQGGLLHNLKRKPLINYFILFFFMFNQMIYAIKLISQYKCKVIHAHWVVPQGLIAVLVKKILFWKKISVLITVHGGDIYGVSGNFANIIKNWVFRNTDAVTVVSKTIADDLVKVKKIYVRSMGVDSQTLFVPLRDSKRTNLLFVGRLVDKKGCDVLLKAFQIVLTTCPNLRLNIIGDGPELNVLKDICISLGIDKNVEFIGALEQKELVRWYQTSRIFIMPSIVAKTGDQEGLGLVAAEAMSCECAVIASNLDAVKDLIDNGCNGLLVDPEDEYCLANAIQSLLDDVALSNRLGKNARKKIVDKFDWSIVGKEYTDIIKALH